jgi:hypothetical protein
MEIIRRKILLENFIDRRENSPNYGKMTADTFYVNIVLTQNIDDMGMFTDMPYVPKGTGANSTPDYTVLIKKLRDLGLSFPFMNGVVPTNTLTGVSNIVRTIASKELNYYNYLGLTISAQTQSRLEDVRTYDKNNVYQLNFNTEDETYTNYSGGVVNGVTRITSLTNPLSYVFDTNKNDPRIGTDRQKDGILFQEYSGFTNRPTIYAIYIGQGFNETNISLSALTKEEYLFGIISKPEVESDVFIDRGIVEIYERHLKMSEITNLGELSRYGRGYYNLTS